MNSNSDRLLDLFSEAMELKSPAESARFLAEVCPGEPELREQLETLLRAHEQAGPFLKKALVATTPDTLLEKLGDRFGHYQLLQKIGEGGAVSFTWPTRPNRCAEWSPSKLSNWAWTPNR